MKCLKLLFFTLMGLLLVGCAGTFVVSREKTTQAPYRLTSATVAWVDSLSLPYKISKQGPQPINEGSDKAYAHMVVNNLLVVFRKNAPQQVTGQLMQNNVAVGSGVFLEIKPTTANVFINGGRGLIVRAAIKDSVGGNELWSVTINAFGPIGEKNEILLEKFVNTLTAELKSAGWL